MLLETEPILRSGNHADFVNDEVNILCNFIDRNQNIRVRFAAWLETYVDEYAAFVKRSSQL